MYTQWIKRGETFLPTDDSKTYSQIEAGLYSIRFSDNVGWYLHKKQVNLDELIELPFPELKEVMSSIETFWKRKDKFKEYGYAFKRGILLYGVPGGGKTSIINLLCKYLIEKLNGVVFTITDDGDLGRYSAFMPEIYRTIERERPIITVIEDIDGLCSGGSTETALINLLDGIDQMENVVYIATTNYTERLSARVLNRPNRFDRRFEVTSPNEECREIYFRHKLKENDLANIDMQKWVEHSKGLTMAHLGEIIKSVAIMGNDFDETITTLRQLREIPVSSNYDKGNQSQSIGFSRGAGFIFDVPSYKKVNI